MSVTPVTDTMVCEWFALCTRPAIGTTHHEYEDGAS